MFGDISPSGNRQVFLQIGIVLARAAMPLHVQVGGALR